MHELSLAGAIVSIAEENAHGRHVARVEVACGRLRQVVPEALTFAFELVAQGTVVEGAELTLDEVAVRIRCRCCGEETEMDGFPFACPRCHALDVDVTDGEQLQVVALELEEVEVVGSK